jgi:folate-binding protein YgfZ
MSASDSAALAKEYAALRGGRGLAPLNGWTYLSIAGADRQKFVHNFSTNDVKRLKPAESCEAFFTNAKGKIVGHGLVGCLESELLFFGAPKQGPRLVEHLDRYIIREDVQLREVSSERCGFLACDGRAHDSSCLAEFDWDLIGDSRARVVLYRASEADDVLLHAAKSEITIVGRDAFDAARIEAGFPIYGVDFDDSNLPQEIGRNRQAISFTKGCYLGQETVARIDALGHVNQQIVVVKFASEIPAVGTALSRNEVVMGRVTSGAWSPLLSAPLALAMVRRESSAVGTVFESAFGQARVIELPLAALDPI